MTFSRLILGIIIIPLVTGCATSQVGISRSPADGISEINKNADIDELPTDQVNSAAYYYFLVGELNFTKRNYKESIVNYEKATQ